MKVKYLKEMLDRVCPEADVRLNGKDLVVEYLRNITGGINK